MIRYNELIKELDKELGIKEGMGLEGRSRGASTANSVARGAPNNP